MGLRDWWRRQVGDDRPAGTGVPAPPGEPEILGSLQQVAAMLDDGAVSGLVRSRVRRIDRLIRQILPRLPSLGFGSQDAYAVVATATSYLPESLGAYLRLPREWADSRPIDNGRTALMVLIDQLELLGATMEKMLDAAVRADATALIAHGRFLEAKFGADSSGGALDMDRPGTGGAGRVGTGNSPGPTGSAPVREPTAGGNELDLG